MKLLIILSILIVMPVSVLAVCTGTYPTTISACANVTSTVHIPGGSYASAYNANAANTEYILDGDITANGTGITVNAANVVVNLNGHTITYNQTTAGDGINTGSYNNNYLAITNGSIIQGAAMTPGTLGEGQNNIHLSPYLVGYLQVTDIIGSVGSKDTGAIFAKGTHPLIENNHFTDTFGYGDLTDRHIGVDFVFLTGEYAIVRNNTLVDCRHRGITVNNYSEVYGNTIGLKSIATNASGVGGWAVHDIKVHDNIITGRGEHPIGIGFSGPPTTNIEIYNNVIDVQTTQLGCEYGGDPSDCTQHVGTCWTGGAPCATDHATGIRCHKEGHNIYVHDNTITVRTDSNYTGTYSIDGASVQIFTRGRGIQIGGGGIQGPGSATYENNTVYAMDKDGSGYVGGIVCDTNYDNGSLLVIKNTITSNLYPVVLADGYGFCQGHPLFMQNTIIKSSSYTATPNYPGNFNTIATGLSSTGFTTNYAGTGTFISNNYSGGAAQNDLNLHFETAVRSTTLTANMDATQTFASVASSSGFLSTEIAKVDDELMIMTSDPTNGSLPSLQRGAMGTVATTHNSGTTVFAHSTGDRSVIFGRLMEGTVKDATNTVLPNIKLTTLDSSSNIQTTDAVTNSSGVTQFILYDTKLDNAEGSTGSVTPIEYIYAPHTVNLYDQTAGATLFDTLPDSTGTAWDALTSSGTYTLTDAAGSITINTSAGDYVPPIIDGLCGSADGLSFLTAPSTYLCAVGMATTVTGTGPWSWSCLGVNGGTDDACSANLTNTDVTAPSITGISRASGTATSAKFSWSFTDSDNIGVTSRLYCISAIGQTCTPTTHYTGAVTIYPGSNVCAQACDAADNCQQECANYPWPTIRVCQ